MQVQIPINQRRIVKVLILARTVHLILATLEGWIIFCELERERRGKQKLITHFEEKLSSSKLYFLEHNILTNNAEFN